MSAREWNRQRVGVGQGFDLNPWIPVIGGVATGVIDAVSQDRANKATARDVRAQIDFQREQNATAYQRAVADMRAAGLNPALAYKQGGADSGSGAAGQYKPISISDKFAAAVDSYNNFANGSAQRQLLREQANKTVAETKLATANAAVLQPDAAAGQNPEYIRDRVLSLIAKARGERQTAENIPTRLKLENAATAQSTATARQQEALLGTETTLNEQEFMNEWFRKNIAPYLNSTAKAMDAGTRAIGAAGTAGWAIRNLRHQRK